MGEYEGYEPRRAPRSRLSVLLTGLIIGAIAASVLWFALAGNPLSDSNEVVYQDITVASVNLDKNTVCWSEDPSRRDAGQICAILGIDRSQDPPMPGTRVTIGTVMLQPPGQEASRQAVYAAPLRRGGRDQTPDGSGSEPAPSESD